jgi:hypothetical protein
MDAKGDKVLEWPGKENALGLWIQERETEGWMINWPEYEGLFEEMKAKMSLEFPEIIVHASDGKKSKKG